MDRKSWKAPNKESLKEAYENRGKYPDKDGNRRFIFNDEGNTKVWKVLDKAHKVRLLPVHPDDNINFYGMTVHIHTNVGVNGDQFLCLKRMKSSNCPICEQQATLWDTEPDMAKTLYPQARYLIWVVDLSQSLDNQVAQIWSCPRTAMDDILGISYKKATDEILNLADIDDGIVIYFDREKAQGTTFSKYKNFQLDDKVTPIKDTWLSGIEPFYTLLEYATYDDIKNTFLGLDKDTTEDVKDVKKEEVIEKAKEIKKEEPVEKAKEADSTVLEIDDMDRDTLEELAIKVLADDFEKDEIEEMGIKKLRRLVKEAPKREDISIEEASEDPKEVLKRKLRERVNS